MSRMGSCAIKCMQTSGWDCMAAWGSDGSIIVLCRQVFPVSVGFPVHALYIECVSLCVFVWWQVTHILSTWCTRDTPTCFCSQSVKRPCDHKVAIQLPILPCSTHSLCDVPCFLVESIGKVPHSVLWMTLCYLHLVRNDRCLIYIPSVHCQCLLHI